MDTAGSARELGPLFRVEEREDSQIVVTTSVIMHWDIAGFTNTVIFLGPSSKKRGGSEIRLTIALGGNCFAGCTAS